jgi:putative tricarboxylic transport membrane protein
MLGARKYPLGAIDNPGPGFLPFLLGLALGGMSIALFIRNWKKKDSQPEVTRPEGRGWIKVSSIFLMLLLFTLFFEITGYIVNVFLFFLVLLRPIGRQKWSWSLSISIGAASISYILFERWLMLPLPRGIWFQ